ncbi:MAG: cysteine--tRNA ligase [Myxococcota bacterium]|jgi:cysteinyl-tRNA synthetase|nr:cysteine--tRNA ligase [Myxococcota bacterium]
MSELHVYNSLGRKLEPLVPQVPGKVGIYVCGMTVYDYCHIGHARAMITFDMVVRWLRASGFEVTYVRNYTDVDDKIIARAQETGTSALELSARFIEALDEDLERLGLEVPDVQPKVSDHIEDIIGLIERIIDNGHGYVVEGDVFFAVESRASYGELSGKKLEDLRAGERVLADTRKRHPGDFALWKASKPDEISWESPWGPGRPGWHIECSAMSQRYLGSCMDVHGGGIDLVFPHHENEIVQSECGTGERPFVRYWLHNGHLTLETEKMSKSLGNIVRIRDILDEVPAEALRALYLDGHYRSPLPYSSQRLTDALVALDRLYQAKETLELTAAREPNESPEQLMQALGEPARDLHESASTFEARFTEAMNDDFNTPRALGALYTLVRAANRFGNDKKARKRGSALARLALPAFELAGQVLGIGGRTPDAFFDEVRIQRLRTLDMTREQVQQRIDARKNARDQKDWTSADAIRGELDALGVVLMDTPQGTDWRMRIAETE